MDIQSKIESAFSFNDPAWHPFPRKVHSELNLASNELWHNTDTKAGALICPLGDRRPEFIVSKAGLDYLHDAKQKGKITEGYVVLSRWTDAGREVAKVTLVADIVSALKDIMPNQGRGLYGPFYWLQADGTSSDQAPF
jgi:hypothetical protein